MIRTARGRLPGVGLLVLVAASVVLHWVAGRRLSGLWILPDEAIYAARAVALWRGGPVGWLHGGGSGYGLLYPAVAGLPLSSGSIARGYASLKLLQALVVSLAAVPVFVYGRRLMPSGYALLAAALTVASPLLLYSGLVMTEVLFYPAAAVALLAVANAVERAGFREQGIALAAILVAGMTRVQAVAFVPVFACAILLDHLWSRRARSLREFWPTWLVLMFAVASLAVFPRAVGSYSGTLRGAYPLEAALRLSFDHLSYLALSTGLAPAAALVLLSARAVRGFERDPAARALIAVCLSAIGLVVLQVGLFAARYAPHVLGRDLASLPPLLFLVFALWIARGESGGLYGRSLSAFFVLSLVLLSPWNTLVDPGAYADSLDLQLLARVRWHTPAEAVMVFAILMLSAFVLVPRRAALVLPLGVLAVLIAASVVASNGLSQVDNAAQAMLGTDRSWIDHAPRRDGDVAYLFDDGPHWNTVWQERFWNTSIGRVYSVAPAVVPGPMSQTRFTVSPDGRIPLREHYVVATDTHTFIGEPIAHLPQEGLEVSGLTLWHLAGQPKLSTTSNGVQPNGDITHPAKITVYGCTGGHLELTLLPKATKVVRVLLNGRLALERDIEHLRYWNGSIPAPAKPRTQRCIFTILPQPLLGSTRILFIRD